MNRRFWLGVAAGITATIAARTALIWAVSSLLHHAEMTEERPWTQDDDLSWRELLNDRDELQP